MSAAGLSNGITVQRYCNKPSILVTRLCIWQTRAINIDCYEFQTMFASFLSYSVWQKCLNDCYKISYLSPTTWVDDQIGFKLNETYLEVEFWHSWYTPDFKFAQQGKLTRVGL